MIITPPYIPVDIIERLNGYGFNIEVWIPWIFHEVTISGDWYTLHDEIYNHVMELIHDNILDNDISGLVQRELDIVVNIFQAWMDANPIYSPLRTASIWGVTVRPTGWIVEYTHDPTLIDKYNDSLSTLNKIVHIPRTG